MFYRCFRALTAIAFRLFFQVDRPVDPHHSLGLEGPVIFVGNHPNGLVDPGLFFVLTARKLTFLAKAPIFKMPILGAILRGLDALPVYRRQDSADTAKNEGTLAASVDALVEGRAITLFPEGKSHSEPQLAELKTGCARIALEAARRGAGVRIVPVGFTYAAKHLYRSKVHVEAGPPLEVTPYLEPASEDPRQAVVQLTQAIADALKAVTLNLEKWEDLTIVETAEALYALNLGETPGGPERQRAFARGLAQIRAEQPARFGRLYDDLLDFRRRLDLLSASPGDLATNYRPWTVARFVIRNLLWLVLLPMFGAGMALFTVPYFFPQLALRIARPDHDTESTVKLLAAMVAAPSWWALLTIVGALAWGWAGAVVAFLGVPPLALFTRVFYERRTAALQNVRLFFVLGSRSASRRRLHAEGVVLSTEIERLVQEYGARATATG